MFDIPEPVELLGPSSISTHLATTQDAATNAALAGCFGPLYRVDGSIAVLQDPVIAVAKRPLLTQDEALKYPRALVLKASPAQGAPQLEDRKWKGVHANMSWADIEQGTLKNWPVKRDVVGAKVVITVGQIVVAVGTIQETHKAYGRINIKATQDDGSSPWNNVRVKTRRGPMIEYWGDWND